MKMTNTRVGKWITAVFYNLHELARVHPLIVVAAICFALGIPSSITAVQMTMGKVALQEANCYNDLQRNISYVTEVASLSNDVSTKVVERAVNEFRNCWVGISLFKSTYDTVNEQRRRLPPAH